MDQLKVVKKANDMIIEKEKNAYTDFQFKKNDKSWETNQMKRMKTSMKTYFEIMTLSNLWLKQSLIRSLKATKWNQYW